MAVRRRRPRLAASGSCCNLNDWPDRACLRLSGLAWAPDAQRPHHPQSRLSGLVQRRAGAAAGHPARGLRRQWASSSTANCRFSNAGIFYASHVTTVSANLCRGDHPAGAGLWSRWPARATGQGRPADRHPERHRRRRQSRPACPVSMPRIGRASRPMPTIARRLRPRGCHAVRWFAIISRLCTRRASTWRWRRRARCCSRVAAGGDRRGERRLEAPLCRLERRHPGQVGVRIGFEEAEARRMYAGQRLSADALALRAVRPEPDVRPALRHAADRPSHRRPGRHHPGTA